jgi:hypothetical protein
MREYRDCYMDKELDEASVRASFQSYPLKIYGCSTGCRCSKLSLYKKFTERIQPRFEINVSHLTSCHNLYIASKYDYKKTLL